VNALRLRQVQNLMATLLLARGVPMITAGDELGRTQQGNNNAYCQDSHISWVHWDTVDDWADLTDLTRTLLALRRDHGVFQRTGFCHGEEVLSRAGQPTGRKNLAWFGPHRNEMTPDDWADGSRRTLGMYLADDDSDRAADEAFLIWFHSGTDSVEVELPDGSWAGHYTVLAHSGAPGELPGHRLEAGGRLRLPGRTVVVLQVD
jgi:glycogen operon protein